MRLLRSLGAWLMIVAGMCLAGLGLLLDFVFLSSQPGIGLPQFLVLALGLGIAGEGVLLLRDQSRERLANQLRANLSKCSVITMLTLIILELTLTMSGLGTYFVTDLPPFNGKVLYWYECDRESGCRFDPEMVIASCERGELVGRRCAINRDGFRDDDEFIAPPADIEHRVLLLGDSFTHGFTADLGKAFPELLDEELSEALVWNAGYTGNGTNGALASFKAFAPRLQPQLTLLGFYTGNDFSDNLHPPDGWMRVEMEDGLHKSVRRYSFDRLGNPLKLDLETTLHYHARRKPAPNNLVEKVLGSTRLGTLLLRALDRLGEIVVGTDQQRQNRLTRMYLENLQEAVAANDSQLLALIVPSIKDMTKPSVDYMAAVALMRELAIPHIEVRDLLGADTDYHERDPHWNNSGHGVVGALLSECIEAFFAAGSLSACERVVIPER